MVIPSQNLLVIKDEGVTSLLLDLKLSLIIGIHEVSYKINLVVY